MRNVDQALFRRARRFPEAAWEDAYQALPQALSAEFEARAFYRRMSEAFGAKAPSRRCWRRPKNASAG